MIFDGCTCDCEMTFRVLYRDPPPTGRAVDVSSLVGCPCCGQQHNFPGEVIGMECLESNGEWKAADLADLIVVPGPTRSQVVK